MPRGKKERHCRRLDGEKMYKPAGIPGRELEDIIIELDEFEAMRLCDMDEKNQIEASESMKVSRATVQRLLGSGRKKLMEALLNNKAIIIKNE